MLGSIPSEFLTLPCPFVQGVLTHIRSERVCLEGKLKDISSFSDLRLDSDVSQADDITLDAQQIMDLMLMQSRIIDTLRAGVQKVKKAFGSHAEVMQSLMPSWKTQEKGQDHGEKENARGGLYDQMNHQTPRLTPGLTGWTVSPSRPSSSEASLDLQFDDLDSDLDLEHAVRSIEINSEASLDIETSDEDIGIESMADGWLEVPSDAGFSISSSGDSGETIKVEDDGHDMGLIDVPPGLDDSTVKNSRVEARIGKGHDSTSPSRGLHRPSNSYHTSPNKIPRNSPTHNQPNLAHHTSYRTPPNQISTWQRAQNLIQAQHQGQHQHQHRRKRSPSSSTKQNAQEGSHARQGLERGTSPPGSRDTKINKPVWRAFGRRIVGWEERGWRRKVRS